MRLGHRSWYVVIFVLWAAAIVHSQAATPLGAIDELTRAETFDEVIKHYPAALEEAVIGLPEKEKAEILKRLAVAAKIRDAGCELRRTDDLRSWQFVDAVGNVQATLNVINYFISGADALVEFTVDSSNQRRETKFISLRYEEGSWRIMSAGDWRKDVDLQSPGFIGNFTPGGRNEKAAASTLAEVLVALSHYVRSHPGLGLPTSLDVLSEPVIQQEAPPGVEIQDSTDDQQTPEDSEAAKEPAPPYLADMVFINNRAIKDGYEFRYVLTDSVISDQSAGKFQLTATPLEFGKTGSKSFMIDQSDRVYYTSENRLANESDDTVDYSFISASEALFEVRIGGRRIIR